MRVGKSPFKLEKKGQIIKLKLNDVLNLVSMFNVHVSPYTKQLRLAVGGRSLNFKSILEQRSSITTDKIWRCDELCKPFLF